MTKLDTTPEVQIESSEEPKGLTKEEMKEIEALKELVREIDKEEASSQNELEDILVGITILVKLDGSIIIEPLMRDDYNPEYGKLLGQLIYTINQGMLQGSFLEMLTSIHQSKTLTIKRIAKAAIKEWNSANADVEAVKPSSVLKIGIQRIHERQSS